jgi:phage tail sheath protein FI
MAEYLAPGVYIEEVPGQRPIEGVGTATGAFVGVAERGPIGQPVLITNWTQFVDTFGGYIGEGYLAYAVNHFFTEGGTRCYAVRTCHYTNITNAATATARASRLVLQDRGTPPVNTLRVDASSAGSWGDNLAVIVENATKDPGNKFKLTVLERGVAVETYDELAVADAPGVVNTLSSRVIVTNLNSTTAAPGNRPAPSAVAFNGLVVTALARTVTLEIVAGATVGTFKIVLRQAGSLVETDAYDNLTLLNVERRINGISRYIRVAVVSATAPVPTTATALPFFTLSGGWDGLVGQAINDRAGQPTLNVSAAREGITIDVADAATDPANRFKITVNVGGTVAEQFDNLTMADVEQVVNDGSAYIVVDDLASPTTPPGNRPAVQQGTIVPSGLDDSDFVGDEAGKNGLHAFDAVDDINIVAIPDRPGDRAVILAAYTYCQNRKDCFFVADPPMGLTPQQVQSFKDGTGDYAGNAFNSSYAALYYPWILASDPRTGGIKRLPPSGAVVGTYSHTDVARGVHKAPAGIDDGILDVAVGVERLVTKGEQALLNPDGINVIRSFPGTGIAIWGARTLSAIAEWKYVNVRRLLLFIEESLEQGTQWVVFEPNDRGLWARVRRDVTAFLTVVWQSGALFGATAAEAFFVKVDDENNPPEVRDLGRLIIDVGVAPVKPAEFVIFRIAQRTQGAKG